MRADLSLGFRVEGLGFRGPRQLSPKHRVCRVQRVFRVYRVYRVYRVSRVSRVYRVYRVLNGGSCRPGVCVCGAKRI